MKSMCLNSETSFLTEYKSFISTRNTLDLLEILGRATVSTKP